MSQPEHRLCPVCGVAFSGGEAVLQCSGCNVVHHTACWIEGGACSTVGEHASQPLPRTFGGALPPGPPADRPAPVRPPASRQPRAPLLRGAAGRQPRSLGALGDRGQPRDAGWLLRFWYAPAGLLLAGAIAASIVWGLDRIGNGGEAVPAVVPATPSPSPLPTPTQPPSPSPTPAPAATATAVELRFSPGAGALVAGTDSCLNIRAEASIGAAVIDCIPDGTEVTLLDGPVTDGGITWWLVVTSNVNGWAAELYLVER